jgi:beta-N-acetylhexosaminidase
LEGRRVLLLVKSKSMGKKLLSISFAAASVLSVQAQFSPISQDSTAKEKLETFQKPPFVGSDSAWVDGVLNSLSLEEKIGQLFMVAAYSNKDEEHYQQIDMLVEKYGIGGLIFFQGGPVRQAVLTNRYQSKAKVPLMIGMDAEWGLSMRLDSTQVYPRQMALGAVQDERLIYQMGRQVADQCKRLGVHVNFAPVIDVNNNPNNPVINSRSFGEDKLGVTKRGMAYMRGMQDNGVLACGKHFPGHGDTDSDSHKSLPTIKHDRERLDDVEMFPFRELINGGLGSMMIAHLNIPALDPTEERASTLSRKIVTDLLVNELNFKGLKFTDALNMKGVSSYFKPGEVDLLALKAGNDVLLFPEDVPLAVERISKAIADGELSEAELDAHLRLILETKAWLGLQEVNFVNLENLSADLNKPEYELLRKQLREEAITLLRNRDQIVPLKSFDTRNIAVVTMGNEARNAFSEQAALYTRVKSFGLPKNSSQAEIQAVKDSLQDYDLLLFSFQGTSQYPWKKFGVKSEQVQAMKKLAKGKQSILAFHGNPYALKAFKYDSIFSAILVTYADGKYELGGAAQALFGGLPIRGKLPVSIPGFESGSGEEVSEQIRLRYTMPEELGIPEYKLRKIDEIAQKGVDKMAYPGCQLLIAKEGKVFYHKSFGYHTYENKRPVKWSDLYDIASITKIAASTVSFMKLQEAGKVNLEDDICYHLEDLIKDTSEYIDIKVREMLSHQAGLVPWIPFYKDAMADGHLRYEYFSLAQSETYPNEVAPNLFAHKNTEAEIIKKILETPLKKKEYKYSDLGYYFLKRIIEKQAETSLDSFAQREIYAPLGMDRSGFLPKQKYRLEDIVPTEYDLYFRMKQIHGDVHDPGSAMLGGVAGHAGLFSNANDMAKFMQMLLNWGKYGGKTYLQESTVKEFTDCQYCEDNRRGAGFDKPVKDGGPGPTCECISFESFGHTGFTGTIAWADPEEEIVYVFLSNRVYPDASNKKMIEMNIRTDIMEAIYDALPDEDSLSLQSR